ncbi:lytic transglycosylase domain-containing protein [Myxococcota bacterium]|nr:lytic transglycosylase domain-containing protein [Myxococcota bacterium]
MQGTARRLAHGLIALLFSAVVLAPSTAESTSRELPTRAQVYVSAPEGEATAEAAAPSFFNAEHPLVDDELRRVRDSRGYAVAYLRAVEEFSYYEDMVLDAFEAEGVPFELAAVPIIESGYKNVVQVVPKGYDRAYQAAGVWQFIPGTARAFGLTVGGGVDERMNPAAQTVAAARYFRKLYDQLGDWGLALAGYNQGPRRVQDAIERTGERDVFTLIELGAINNYAIKVRVAADVLKDPELLTP